MDIPPPSYFSARDSTDTQPANFDNRAANFRLRFVDWLPGEPDSSHRSVNFHSD